MTPIDAKNIIDKYHQSIKDLRPNAIVQSSDARPYTSARIKYAHFVYGEDLIKSRNFTEEAIKELRESFGIIDSLFREDSEQINAKYREYIEGLRNGLITEFRMPNPFGEIEPVIEFHIFLDECWFLDNRTKLFNNSVLGAFMYDGVRNKATTETDIKTLIQLVNSSLTRDVCYPGKKSNAESVFIQL
jgi:hypothetical protein